MKTATAATSAADRQVADNRQQAGRRLKELAACRWGIAEQPTLPAYLTEQSFKQVVARDAEMGRYVA